MPLSVATCPRIWGDAQNKMDRLTVVAAHDVLEGTTLQKMAEPQLAERRRRRGGSTARLCAVQGSISIFVLGCVRDVPGIRSTKLNGA